MVRALHQARTPGGFAQALELARICVLHRWLQTLAPDQLRDVNAPDYGVRRHAKDRLDVRCRRLDLISASVLASPVSGDVHGERFIEAFNALKASQAPFEVRAAALREVFAQGVPDEVVRRLWGYGAWWRGQSWDGRDGDYGMAARLATWRSSAGSGPERDDIRLLWECYTTGRCAGRFDEEVQRLPEPRRRAVMALAREMEAAIRNRDATPFLPPEPQ